MKVQHVIGGLLALLLVKFLAPLVLFDVPLGYDPGIYRYLFVKYADALGTFSMPDLLPWATEHPPGLYLVGAVLMKLGVPVDALIGWIWNLFPPLLAGVFAWVISKRQGVTVGVLVLLFAFISPAYYDGFFAMYYKVYAALILVCLTYYFAEKLSPWFLLTAFLTVAVHHQTGLIMTIALGIWWMSQLPSQWNNPTYKKYTIGLLCITGLALLVYLPNFERMFWSPLKSIFLLRGDKAPSGAFPETSFYLQSMPIILGFGAVGFWQNIKHEKGTLWQISAFACAIFIVFRLVFYKRFFLHLDFFLMPFAAEGLLYLWKTYYSHYSRLVVIILLVAQGIVSAQVMMTRKPRLSSSEFSVISQLHTEIDSSSAVITLDNVTGPWLLGWLPNNLVGAPGLFDYPNGTLEQWTTFIYKTNADREYLLGTIKEDVYFYASPIFMDFYKQHAIAVISDPCFERLRQTPLYHSLCSGE